MRPCIGEGLLEGPVTEAMCFDIWRSSGESAAEATASSCQADEVKSGFIHGSNEYSSVKDGICSECQAINHYSLAAMEIYGFNHRIYIRRQLGKDERFESDLRDFETEHPGSRAHFHNL
jgi:hypothetical protein